MLDGMGEIVVGSSVPNGIQNSDASLLYFSDIDDQYLQYCKVPFLPTSHKPLGLHTIVLSKHAFRVIESPTRSYSSLPESMQYHTPIDHL